MNPELRTGGWSELRALALAVRYAVFVEEQGVPEALEIDVEDPAALHAVALVNGRAIATGRLLPGGKIGRMAVLPGFRRRGVGSRILSLLIAQARERGLSRVYLDAQLPALPFYRRYGFQAHGEVFEDAGLPHRRMDLALPSSSG